MNTTEALIPAIPQDAPFTPAQRAWLNGFIAGLYSYAPASGASRRDQRVALLYGSQTGTAEGLARKLAKELKGAGFSVDLSSLEGYVPASLAAERLVLFVVSTYGEGEAPDAAQPFYQQLCVEHFPLLGDLSFAVLALGDSHYEHFCQFGKDLDARLEFLGGTRVLNRVDCDVEFEVPWTSWKASVLSKLGELADGRANASAKAAVPETEISFTGSPASVPAAQVHTRDNPYLSPLAEKRALTHPSSTKLTIHLDFVTEDADIHYEVGDACGVIPQNSPALVDEVLRALPFSGVEAIEIPKVGIVSLREALLHHLAINQLTRKMAGEYAALTQCAPLAQLLTLDRQKELEEYIYGRDLVDLLREWPCAPQLPADLLRFLPRMVPRLYSISSSPAAHPGRIHTTVSVVRYRAHDRERGGVCSTLFADRMNVGDHVPLYIQPNRRFRLPEDPSAPVIMIGPGTGIAPFRAFLHHRRITGAGGRNWLFFGERCAATDFLYREELEPMLSDGHLNRLDAAFSRDQERKVYVQDLMQQNAREVWSWIEAGAYLYICGDAERMAKDVDRMLQAILQTEGGMNSEAAADYVETLRSERRYQRDVY